MKRPLFGTRLIAGINDEPEANFRLSSRLCENSDVELARREFVSITLNKKRTALAVVVEGGKGRKQFCAFSARARFHTAWVKSGSGGISRLGPLYAQQRTFTGSVVYRSRRFETGMLTTVAVRLLSKVLGLMLAAAASFLKLC